MYTVHFLPCATIEGGNHLTGQQGVLLVLSKTFLMIWGDILLDNLYELTSLLVGKKQK